MDSRSFAGSMDSYYRDHVNLSKDKRTIDILVYDEETDEEEWHTFPAKAEVCETCGGRGTHVNPSVDSHGITSSEWAEEWSYEERESYMQGAYDVCCYECHGEKVVFVPDEPHESNEEALKIWRRWEEQTQSWAYDLAAEARTRRMEMGGY